MDRRHFITLSAVGAAGSILIPGSAMAASDSVLATGLAGGIYYTKEQPGRWKAKAGGHAPLIESKAGMVMVTTPHEMNGYEHYIVKHTLLDVHMNVIGETMFDPMKVKAAISQYQITEYKGVAYALSMCNKHDCWVTQFTV
jgi:superoxide reductase